MPLYSVLFAAALATVCWAQAPIPPRSHHTQGPPDAPIVFEFWVDHLCPDCKQAAPTMASLVQHYGNNMFFAVNVFPLPYHHNAFLTARAGEAVHAIAGDTAWRCFYNAAWSWQDQLWDNNSSNRTEDQVNAQLVAFGSQCGVDAKKLAAFTVYGGAADSASRVMFKQGCSRGVTGTPAFFVNNVQVFADPSWSLEQWTSVLDPILPSKRKEL